MKNPNRVKAGKRSRTKGATYERKIAKLLNERYGWDLVRNLEQTRRDLHGDLVDRKSNKMPAILGGTVIFIECKNRPTAITLSRLLHTGEPIRTWIQEAREKEADLNNFPDETWLFFKIGTEDFVSVDSGGDLCIYDLKSFISTDSNDKTAWIELFI